MTTEETAVSDDATTATTESAPSEATGDAVEHTLKATKSIAQEIHDAVDAAEVGEDVWAAVDVNEPNNPQSSVAFTIEGDDSLYYEVRVTPKVDG